MVGLSMKTACLPTERGRYPSGEISWWLRAALLVRWITWELMQCSRLLLYCIPWGTTFLRLWSFVQSGIHFIWTSCFTYALFPFFFSFFFLIKELARIQLPLEKRRKWAAGYLQCLADVDWTYENLKKKHFVPAASNNGSNTING